MVVRSPYPSYDQLSIKLATAVTVFLAAACTATGVSGPSDNAPSCGAEAPVPDLRLVQVGWSGVSQPAADSQPASAGGAGPAGINMPAGAEKTAGADTQVEKEKGQEKSSPVRSASSGKRDVAEVAVSVERRRQLLEMVRISAQKTDLKAVVAAPREQPVRKTARRGRGVLTANDQIFRLGGLQLQQDAAKQAREASRLRDEEAQAQEAEDSSQEPVVINDVESDSIEVGNNIEDSFVLDAPNGADEEHNNEPQDALGLAEQTASEEPQLVEQPAPQPEAEAPPPVAAAPVQLEGSSRLATAPSAGAESAADNRIAFKALADELRERQHEHAVAAAEASPQQQQQQQPEQVQEPPQYLEPLQENSGEERPADATTLFGYRAPKAAPSAEEPAPSAVRLQKVGPAARPVARPAAEPQQQQAEQPQQEDTNFSVLKSALKAEAAELVEAARAARHSAASAASGFQGAMEHTGAFESTEQAAMVLEDAGDAAACTDELGCSLNGECRQGRCVCDAAWSGNANCSALAMMPARRGAGYGAINSSASSWGAGVVYDPVGEKYVMIAEEMDMGCGLQTWNLNSRCIVADSKTVDGEYTFRGVVVDAWAHSCTPARDPVTGIWIVSHVGAGNNNQLHQNTSMQYRCAASSAHACTDGPGQREHCTLRQSSEGALQCSIKGCTGGCSSGNTPGKGEPRTVVPCSGGHNAFNESVTASSPYGPWQMSRRLHAGLHGGMEPWFLSNGTLLSISSSGTAVGAADRTGRKRSNRPSIMRSESLEEATNGAWTKLPWRSVLAGSGEDFSDDETAWPQVWWEDHHIFTDKRGNFHILAHAWSSRNTSFPLPGCYTEPVSLACRARIGHAFSRNAVDWYISPVAAATAQTTFEDGETVQWRARERPHVVQNEKGDLVALVTGVGDPHCGGANTGVAGCDHTFTLVERLKSTA